MHGKRIGTGASTHPEDIDVVFQGQLNVLGRGNFGGNVHARLGLYALQPRQSLLAVALEATGFSARFPYTCTEVVAAQFLQLTGCCHDLFLGFGRARACNDDRSFVVGRQIQWL